MKPNQDSQDELRMEVEKRVHLAMLWARDATNRSEGIFTPMVKDTTNIIMEAAQKAVEHAEQVTRDECRKRMDKAVVKARIDELEECLIAADRYDFIVKRLSVLKVELTKDKEGKK